jgi:hypothetical protein
MVAQIEGRLFGRPAGGDLSAEFCLGLVFNVAVVGANEIVFVIERDDVNLGVIDGGGDEGIEFQRDGKIAARGVGDEEKVFGVVIPAGINVLAADAEVKFIGSDGVKAGVGTDDVPRGGNGVAKIFVKEDLRGSSGTKKRTSGNEQGEFANSQGVGTLTEWRWIFNLILMINAQVEGPV